VSWFVVVAAAYGSTAVASRIVERNMFHVAPILFLALAAWIAHGCPRPWWAVAPAALLAGTLTLGLPLNAFLNGTIVHSTPALMPIWRWRETTFSAGMMDELVFGAAAVAAAAFVVVPRRLAPFLILVLLGWFALATRPVEALTHAASLTSSDFGVGPAAPDWIDRQVPGSVASFWWAGSTAVPYWEAEFFNRRVGRTYSLTGPYDGMTHTFTYVTTSPTGVLLDGEGDPVRERYVLTDGPTRLRGTIVARNPRPDLVIYRVNGPLSVEARLDGLYPDRWSGATFTYQRFGCRNGRVTTVVESNPLIHPQPIDVKVLSGGQELRRLRVEPGRRRYSVSVPVVPENGRCVVEFQIPTGPASVIDGGDQRQLGLRFADVRYAPD
jgi:hypothetical protein